MKKRQQKREEKKRNHLAQLYALDTRWSPVQHEHTEIPYLTHTSRTRNNDARRRQNQNNLENQEPSTIDTVFQQNTRKSSLKFLTVLPDFQKHGVNDRHA
ncbi:uncharacterized, partial [Tachysurus ichikawai]